MGRVFVKLIVLCTAGVGAYAYRNEIHAFSEKTLPASVHGPMAHAYGAFVGPYLDAGVKAVSPYLPTQVLTALASPDHSRARAPKEGQQDAAGSATQRDGGPAGKQGAPAAKGKGAGPPSPVTATVTQQADMPVILSSPGTVEAMQTVIIKPRVDGQIVEVNFKEGDLVTEGAVLFRLDDRLVKAQIKQAEAQVARDRASLKDAEAILDRRESLLRNKYASEAQTETARQQVEVLKASIAAGMAAVEAQTTQLDYLTIRAPITGRTGSLNSKLGSFVRSADPSLNPMVTINQTKPIAVSFALPQFNLDSLKDAVRTKAQAVITVPGSRAQKVRGTLFFVDNQVDKSTGTLVGKVMVENEDEVLWPGQAVSVDLTVEIKKNLVGLTASGILPAQQGMIAWVIAPDNTVSIRTVKLERVIDQIAYVSDGLKPGERVVIDGQLRLAPGGRVHVQDTRTPTIEKPVAADSQTPASPPAPANAPPAQAGDRKGEQGSVPGSTPAALDNTEPRRNKRG